MNLAFSLRIVQLMSSVGCHSGERFHSVKEALSVLMLYAPCNRRRPFFVSYENGDLRVFSCFVRFLVKENGINSATCLEHGSSDSQIDKPQRRRPKRAELPDVNINTGAQSINTDRASLIPKD